MNVSCLSCWSKGDSIVDAHMGGHIAHAFKYAGYDALIVEGQSDKPVYIKIDDEKVTIEDASEVWGKGTFETNATLTKANGDEFDVASIGPAGENLVPMSCMVTSVGNSGGGGVGAAAGFEEGQGSGRPWYRRCEDRPSPGSEAAEQLHDQGSGWRQQQPQRAHRAPELGRVLRHHQEPLAGRLLALPGTRPPTVLWTRASSPAA